MHMKACLTILLLLAAGCTATGQYGGHGKGHDSYI